MRLSGSELKRSPKTLLISAGDLSSDLYLAHILSELLNDRDDISIIGLGGPKTVSMLNRFDSTGNDVRDVSILSSTGFLEILKKSFTGFRIFRRLTNTLRTFERLDFSLLLDFPAFNVRLAETVKSSFPNCFQIYLIPPRSWDKSGITDTRYFEKLSNFLQLALVPFEWNLKVLLDSGLNALYLGHPLIELLEFSGYLSTDENNPPDNSGTDYQLTILTGSRTHEISQVSSILLEAFKLMPEYLKPAKIILSYTPHTSRYTKLLSQNLEELGFVTELHEGPPAWDAILKADIAIAVSGTVTLECALLNRPAVVIYRIDKLSELFFRLKLSSLPYISLTNLIADREVYPELVQDNLTPKSILSTLERTLLNRSEIVRQLIEIRRKMLSTRKRYLTALSAELEEMKDLNIRGPLSFTSAVLSDKISINKVKDLGCRIYLL